VFENALRGVRPSGWIGLVADGPDAEWPATLDVAALRAGGWTPAPFREFIVKVHSRCNLACDYCYMYEMADQSWRDQPHRMSSEVAEVTARRIGEHARTHKLDRIALVLHGGEPLLADPDLIKGLVDAVRREPGPRVTVDVSVQTNAVRLNERYLQLFDELGVKVGASLDGAEQDNDRHRRLQNGKGSYAAVVAGLGRLTQPRYRHLFSGLLATVDLRNDPVSTLNALAGFEPPRIDFLLPHGTWQDRPPGRVSDEAETPYADWLIPVFDHWWRTPGPGIRLFQEIIRLFLGKPSASEVVGLSPARLVVIETDGTIEQGDVLKATYAGATRTGLHVLRDPLDRALDLPGIAARQLGELALAGGCQACSIRDICGGGLYAHRYQPGRGFAGPSVYCPDLLKLINHIGATMRSDPKLRDKMPERSSAMNVAPMAAPPVSSQARSEALLPIIKPQPDDARNRTPFLTLAAKQTLGEHSTPV
jgi:uncharacterized protein